MPGTVKMKLPREASLSHVELEFMGDIVGVQRLAIFRENKRAFTSLGQGSQGIFVQWYHPIRTSLSAEPLSIHNADLALYHVNVLPPKRKCLSYPQPRIEKELKEAPEHWLFNDA
jgi:hypothetical protein